MADIARSLGFTRARVTQPLNPLLLAPDVQEDVLFLELEPGRQPISERDLRVLAASYCWSEQRERWSQSDRDR
jgi:hypothetical protein